MRSLLSQNMLQYLTLNIFTGNNGVKRMKGFWFCCNITGVHSAGDEKALGSWWRNSLRKARPKYSRR